MASESDHEEGITRRTLLTRSTTAAVTIATASATTGCATVATRAAALGAPEAVRPLIHDLADPDQAVASGDAWIAFCDALKPLAAHVTGPESLGNLQIQTDGLRLLGRLVGLGLDRFMEHGDPRHPEFYDVQTATRKYMGDNPDQSYRTAAIEGSGVYHVRGNLRGAAGIEIGLYAGSFSSDQEDPTGGRRLVDSLDEKTLAVDDDGNFELVLRGADSADLPGTPNVLTLDPDANSILIRTYFWDRDRRQAHELPSIERLDVLGPRPPLDPTELIRGFIATTMFIDGSLDWWNRFQEIKTAPNTLVEMKDDGTIQTPSLVRYLNGIVELDQNEAFVLEFDPTEGDATEPTYWNWVLQNVFGATPDWRDRPIVLNNRDVSRGEDGRVQIVVAHRNPGHPNWMDMSGHPRLLMSMRWRGEAALPKVATRVLPLADITHIAHISGI